MKKIIRLILSVFILSAMYTVPSFASGDITIISPGSDCTSDISEIVVDCDNAEKIIFELDGKKIGETDGETRFPLPEGAVSVGNHTIKVSAIFPDKTAAQDELIFSAKKMIGIKSYFQDFASYEAGKHSSLGINFYPQTGKFVAGQETGGITPDIGVSGEDGDLSMKFSMLIDGAVTSNAPYFKLNNFTNYNTGGIVTAKFKIKTNDSNLLLEMYDTPLPKSGYALIQSGKFVGTDTPLTVDVWHDFEMIVDFFTNDMVINLDGHEIFNGKSQKTGGCTVVEIIPKQSGERTESTRTTVWFDDIDFRQEFEYGLDDISYFDGENWVNADASGVSSDASAIKLNLTQKLDASTVTSDNVALYENGNKVEIETITYNDDEKSVTIVPSLHFSPDSEIRAELSEKIKISSGKATGSALIARFCTEKAALTPSSVTFKKNGSLLLTSAQLQTGDEVSVDAVLNNDTDEPKNMTVIVYVRQNMKLRAIGAKSVVVQPNQSPEITVSLPPLTPLDEEGDIAVKMTLCDTFDNGLPYMMYTEVK